jgi:hypothetical protein
MMKIEKSARLVLAVGLVAAGGVAIGDERPGTPSDTQRGGAEGAATSGQQTRAPEERQTSPSRTSAPGAAASSATASPTTGMAANELVGRVESVDRSKGTLQVAGKTLKVETSTSVKRNGVGAEVRDIQEGDQVRASFSGSGDTLKAERIEVTGSRKPATGTQPATKAPSGPATPSGTTTTPAPAEGSTTAPSR